MSRSDQWIGKTKAGEEFWQNLKNNIKPEKIVIGSYAFNVPDEIYGERIVEGEIIYEEHIQMEPWSSGPMYFINIKKKEKGKKNKYLFDWKYDSRLDMEFDYEKGTYNV